MRQGIIGSVCGIFLCVLLTHSASAGANQCQRISPTKPQNRIAFVIGNSAYRGNIPALVNPSNDASAVSASLSGLGFTVFLATDADDSTIQNCLSQLTATLGLADIGVFYYSGHGIQLKDENYLVATNAEVATSDLKGFVPVQPIVDALQKHAQAALVFLDACRNNPFSEDGHPGLSVTTGRNLDRGLGRVTAGPANVQTHGLLVAYSTSPNSIAADGNGDLSPFTAAFVKTIATPGYSIQRVMAEVTKAVGDETDWAQTPWIKSSLTSEVKLGVRKTVEDSDAAARAAAKLSDDLLLNGKRYDAIAAALKGIPLGTPSPDNEAYKALFRAYNNGSFQLAIHPMLKVGSVAISPNHDRAVLVFGLSESSTVPSSAELFDTATGRMMAQLGSAGFNARVSFSFDGSKVLLEGDAHDLKIFESKKGALLASAPSNLLSSPGIGAGAATNIYISRARFTNNATNIYASSEYRSVIATSGTMAPIYSVTDNWHGFGLKDAGIAAFSANDDGTACIALGGDMNKMLSPTSYVLAIANAPNGSKAARKIGQGKAGAVWDVACGNSNQTIAALYADEGSANKYLSVFDISTGAILADRILVPRSNVESDRYYLRYSDDSQHIFTEAAGQIFDLDIATGSINRASFQPPGADLVASAVYDTNGVKLGSSEIMDTEPVKNIKMGDALILAAGSALSEDARKSVETARSELAAR